MTGSELPTWAAALCSLLLATGGLATLIGAIGLLRLRNFYSRMHPPTMGTGLGAGCVLLTSMLASSVPEGRAVVHEVVIALFIVLTAPVSAMLLMRAAISRTRPDRE